MADPVRKTVFVALQQFCEGDDRPMRVLSEAGFDVRLNTLGRRVRREEMPGLLEGVDAVIAGVEPYDASLLRVLPGLRCISRCGLGTDMVDLEAARKLGITVATTPLETVEPVAQMTVAMIFALARNLLRHREDFEQGKWIKRYGSLLSEWSIGIVGSGRIGTQVRTYLRPFGPKILITDPIVRVNLPGEKRVEFCNDLNDLLRRSHCVTIHAERGPEQGALIGASQFEMMQKGSVLVNTSRGHLVDEMALYQALKSGHLAGAALDVFEKEPYHGPLSKLPNVICTPHVSTLTWASRAAMELRSAKQVVEHFSQGVPCESV